MVFDYPLYVLLMVTIILTSSFNHKKGKLSVPDLAVAQLVYTLIDVSMFNKLNAQHIVHIKRSIRFENNQTKKDVSRYERGGHQYASFVTITHTFLFNNRWSSVGFNKVTIIRRTP